MSKKNLIAIAVAAALFSPTAFAFTVNANASNVATVDIKDATTVVALNATTISISTSDLIIGRTTGFSVRIELPAGATFSALGAPTVGPALPDDGVNGPWTVTLAAGGVGSNFAVYSVQPGGGSKGVINGDLLSWADNAISIAGVASLASPSSVSATVRFADPNTAQEILAAQTAELVSSVNPLTFTVTGGDVTKRIDVGVANYGSKTAFSPNGVVSHPTQELYFNAGQIDIGVAGSVRQVGDVTLTFAWDPADVVDLTVSGDDFSAFAPDRVVIAANATCATATATGVVGATGATFNTTVSNVDGNYLCFIANGTAIIAATDVDASVKVTRAATGASNSGSDDALSMAYNGAVARVYHFNPSTNADQVSYLRLTNTSSTAGLFTIDSTCDDGTAGNPVSLTLGAGRSILLTSGDIENGNATKGLTGAAGACTADNATGVTGKRRLTVTGEVGSMEVQNFLRNVTSAGMINTNVNNEE